MVTTDKDQQKQSGNKFESRQPSRLGTPLCYPPAFPIFTQFYRRFIGDSGTEKDLIGDSWRFAESEKAELTY